MKMLKSTRVKGQSATNGYTIVELMVTVGIFSLAFFAIAAIFLAFSTAQSRAGSAQRLLNEGSFLFESVAREIRMHAVNYTCSPADYDADTDYLCLKSADGQAVHVRITGSMGDLTVDVCRDAESPACATSDDWVELSHAGVTILEAGMYVFPASNPAEATGFDTVFHPMVQLRMTIEAGTGRARQTYTLQTAVSSRVYE